MAFNIENFTNGHCEICDAKFNNRNGLSRHLTRGHKIELLTYFKMHGGADTKCECGNPSTWLFAEMRFSGYCSRKCAAVQIRRDTRNDLKYRENISKAMQQVWAARPRSEVCLLRKAAAKASKENIRLIYSDDWPLPQYIINNLNNFFNLNG